jgi:hypothetical protein
VKFEPLATELYEYFREFGKDLVFPFTRQEVGAYVREHKVFKDLTYPIEKYTIWTDGKLDKTVYGHSRAYNLHALRHQRVTDLRLMYGFDGFNLAAYAGWTLRVSTGLMAQPIPSVLSRYLYLNWQEYFPKLLKRRVV